MTMIVYSRIKVVEGIDLQVYIDDLIIWTMIIER